MEPLSKKCKSSVSSSPLANQSNLSNETNLLTLPDIVLMKILLYLPYFPDVFQNISTVCKKLNIFANDSLIPQVLVINPEMFRGKNHEQMIKVIIRSVRIKQLQLYLYHGSYFTEFYGGMRSLSCEREDNILSCISDKSALKILKIDMDTFDNWYNASINIIDCVSTRLFEISCNNSLEELELGIPISHETLVHILNNLKHSIKSFKIQDKNFLILNEEVFQKLCECYRLEELNIDLSTYKIDLKTGEGLAKLEMLKNLRKLTLSAGLGSNCSVSHMS